MPVELRDGQDKIQVERSKMPIVSSIVAQVMSEPGAFERLRIEHTDHTGKVWTTRVRVPTDVDRAALMELHTAETLKHIEDVEESDLNAFLRAGGNLSDFIANHISNTRMLRRVLKTFMQLDPVNALKIARVVRDNITNEQLEAVTTPAIRQQIRAHITNLISMEIPLAAYSTNIVRID